LEDFSQRREEAAEKIHLYTREGRLASYMWEEWPGE
jgi:hypothetical protein